jgi:hypothetical protein
MLTDKNLSFYFCYCCLILLSEILVPCLVYCFFKQIVDIFFYKSYYQESNILIIAYGSVVTAAEWLDGSFESQNRL